jgi:outer membrane receptor protein involved in Fe transport
VNQSNNKTIISPKLNIHYTITKSVQAYIKTGKGFHSNDTRLAIDKNARTILPAAFGTDIGLLWKPLPNLVINTAAWYLYLEQEFVYVGDEGVVEPSGKTRRIGVDVSARCQLKKWLFADLNVNWARPRAVEEAKGADYIPLAPTLTSIGGLTVQTNRSWNGSVRYRYMKNRAANETNTVTAKGFTVADAIINYTKKKYEIGLVAENIFNAKWNEAQFNTESRLKNEPSSVEEIHFTPGNPVNIRVKIAVFF